jgi:hypothetical protein
VSPALPNRRGTTRHPRAVAVTNAPVGPSLQPRVALHGVLAINARHHSLAARRVWWRGVVGGEGLSIAVRWAYMSPMERVCVRSTPG